jgi:hypothetical protein
LPPSLLIARGGGFDGYACVTLVIGNIARHADRDGFRSLGGWSSVHTISGMESDVVPNL